MTDLVDWYRQETENPSLHPVALAADFHYRFVRIHPFDDGNGRMSRLLMSLILLRHGYSITVAKAANRNRYLAALAEADAGESGLFLRFIIENVESSFRLMIRTAKGESIDEPDDLDKKLALLKKQVSSSETAIKMLWGKETQSKFYDAQINFWLNDLERQTQNFDGLFMSHQYSAITSSAYPHPQKIEEKSDLGIFKPQLKHALSHSGGNIDYIGVSRRWHHFRQKNSGFDIVIVVEFHFNLGNFKVTEVVNTDFNSTSSLGFYSPVEILNSPYLPTYEQKRDHIKKINHQLANKVYDFIAAKIAEADTLPA